MTSSTIHPLYDRFGAFTIIKGKHNADVVSANWIQKMTSETPDELKLHCLKEVLSEGLQQVANGIFADYDLAGLIEELDEEQFSFPEAANS